MIGISNSIMARSLKFGYANARVKAMKQSLLQRRDLEAMADAKNIEDVYGLLERTSYRQDLVDVSLKERTLPDQIELACTRNFSRYLKKVLGIMPKDARPVLNGFFEKYEIENIKMILSSKTAGHSKEKIAPLILETGLLSKAIHSKMLDAKDLSEAMAPLEGTPYSSVIEKSSSPNGRQITGILAALDAYYFDKIRQIASNFPREEKIILEMLKSQIDSRNISAILRSKKEGIKEEKISQMMIWSGNIQKEKLRQAIAAKDVEAAAKVFENDFGLSKPIEIYRKTGSLIPIEVELETGHAKKGLSVLRRSILSIGAIAGFLLIKEEETSNIRKIIRAKEFGLSPEKLKEMLVVV